MWIVAVVFVALIAAGIKKIYDANKFKEFVIQEHNRNLNRCSCLIDNLSSFLSERALRAIEAVIELNLQDDPFRCVIYLEERLIETVGEKITEAHLKALHRKRRTLCIKDEYNLVDTERWEKEKVYFMSNVLIPQVKQYCDSHPEIQLKGTGAYGEYCSYVFPKSLAKWTPLIEEFIDEWEGNTETDNILLEQSATGIEFEHHVAELIGSAGWVARVTPASGDHGADVIASYADFSGAVQCKFYSSPVGNSSVQQAFSAKEFYDCDFAVVVTNSTFTPAARIAADKLNVHLLHEEDIVEFFASFSEEIDESSKAS